MIYEFVCLEQSTLIASSLSWILSETARKKKEEQTFARVNCEDVIKANKKTNNEKAGIQSSRRFIKLFTVINLPSEPFRQKYAEAVGFNVRN